VPLYGVHAHFRIVEKSMPTVSQFEVITPHTVHAALDALASLPNVRPLAGGTDLMVQLEAGTIPSSTFLNLESVRELRSPEPWRNEGAQLTALTTYRDVRTGELAGRFPLLAAAAREVGALAIQSRGTWVGNIANASPAADGVPALMAYDAELEIRSKTASRTVPRAGFYRGYKQMDLRPGELITAIRLPEPQPGCSEYFRKVGTRRFQAISKTLLAGRLWSNADLFVQDLRLIFGSVAPFTLRAFQTERVIRGRELTDAVVAEACEAIQDEIHPIDDIRSSEAYRRRVTGNLLREFLTAHIPETHRAIPLLR
jgi:CO/xanthine dehydrogenase FAD-binding subunit